MVYINIAIGTFDTLGSLALLSEVRRNISQYDITNSRGISLMLILIGVSVVTTMIGIVLLKWNGRAAEILGAFNLVLAVFLVFALGLYAVILTG